MTEITKENFANRILGYVQVHFIRDIANIITNYVTPPNPTDHNIGKYSIEGLLHTVQNIEQCFSGIGKSTDTEFIKRAAKIRLIHVKRRRQETTTTFDEVMISMSEENLESQVKDEIMFKACDSNNTLMVDRLLDNGVQADVGIFNAYMSEHRDLVRYLLKKGASYTSIWPNVCCTHDIEMAQFIVDNNLDKVDEMMENACRYTALSIINLLVDKGANIEEAIEEAEYCDQRVLDLLHSRR